MKVGLIEVSACLFVFVAFLSLAFGATITPIDPWFDGIGAFLWAMITVRRAYAWIWE